MTPDDSTINIKTVGRFTIDYANIYVKEPDSGFLYFFFTFNIRMRDVKSVRVFLQKDGRYITSKTFPTTNNPEENKKNMEISVKMLEQEAVRLNRLYDKQERDERYMISSVKCGGAP